MLNTKCQVLSINVSLLQFKKKKSIPIVWKCWWNTNGKVFPLRFAGFLIFSPLVLQASAQPLVSLNLSNTYTHLQPLCVSVDCIFSIFATFFFLPVFFTFILSQPSVTEPVFHHHFNVLSLARFSVFHLRAFSWNGACECVSSLQEWSVRGTYYLCVDSTQPSRILIRFSALLPWGDKAVDGKDLLTGAGTRLLSLWFSAARGGLQS